MNEPATIKIRVGPGGNGSAAYVAEKPDAAGVHVGTWKHSDEPVAVRWTGSEWVEVDPHAMTLTEFLLARIAEDEALALHTGDCGYARAEYGSACSCGWETRLDAECEAKRRIVEFHESWPVLVESPPKFEQDGDDVTSMTYRMTKQIMWHTEREYRNHFGSEPPTAPMLLALAAIYADHPDYRPEWRP